MIPEPFSVIPSVSVPPNADRSPNQPKTNSMMFEEVSDPYDPALPNDYLAICDQRKLHRKAEQNKIALEIQLREKDQEVGFVSSSFTILCTA